MLTLSALHWSQGSALSYTSLRVEPFARQLTPRRHDEDRWLGCLLPERRTALLGSELQSGRRVLLGTARREALWGMQGKHLKRVLVQILQ